MEFPQISEERFLSMTKAEDEALIDAHKKKQERDYEGMRWLAACVICEIRNAKRTKTTDHYYRPEEVFKPEKQERKYRSQKEKEEEIFKAFRAAFN